MGSELVQYVRRWCDRCEATGDDVEETRIVIGGEGGRHLTLDRVVDLCPACFAEHLAPLVEAFGDLGEATDKVIRRQTSGDKRVPPGSASHVDRRCKLCLKVPSTSTALWQHAKQIHDMTRGEYRAAPTKPDSALGLGVSA